MIPISPTLQKILDRRKLGPDSSELPATAYMFRNEVGELMKKEFVGALWRATCKAANVKELHFHDLRREFGSQLLEAGHRSTPCAMHSAIRASR
jgi:integrase